MPEPPGGYLGSGSDKQGWWWHHFLQDVIEIDLDPGSIVWCPARKVTGPGVRGNLLCGNYGVNRSVCKDDQGVTSCAFSSDPLRSDQVQKPSRTLLIADSGYSLISWLASVDTGGPVFENPDRVDSFYIPGLALNQTRSELQDNSDAIQGRHPHRTLNVGFVDGHNEVRAAESLAIEQAAADSGKLPPVWIP